MYPLRKEENVSNHTVTFCKTPGGKWHIPTTIVPCSCLSTARARLSLCRQATVNIARVKHVLPGDLNKPILPKGLCKKCAGRWRKAQQAQQARPAT